MIMRLLFVTAILLHIFHFFQLLKANLKNLFLSMKLISVSRPNLAKDFTTKEMVT
jgi:hypothetical protein